MSDNVTRTGPPLPVRWIRLRVVASDAKELYGKELACPGPSVEVGRDPQSGLVLNDASISRHHARFEAEDDGSLTIYDLESSNGLTISGKRLAKGKVLAGQSFSLGSVTLELIADSVRAIGRDMKSLPVAATAVVKDFDAIIEKARQATPLETAGKSVDEEQASRFTIDDQPDSVWLVKEGEVDFFALRSGEKGAHAKRHLFTIRAGQAIFGMALSSASHLRLRIESRPGAALVRFDGDELRRQALIPLHRGRIGQLMAGWINALSETLVRDRKPPREDALRVADGKEAKVHGEAFIQADRELVWLEVPLGASLTLNDDATFSHDVEGLLFPVPPGSWIELLYTAVARLRPASTPRLIHDARLWAGLDRFHEGFQRCLPWLAVFQDAADKELLNRRSAEEERVKEEAFLAFESVLGGNERFQAPYAATEGASLLLACQELGRAQGFEVRANPFARPQVPTEDALREIATASGFQIRRIRLGEEWWQSDQGPMLGELQEGGAVVALLPTSPTSYRCFDPRTGTQRTATADLALELSGFGFVLYRPLPTEQLSRRSLLRFAQRGLGLDLRWVLFMSLLAGGLGTAVPIVTGMVFDSAIPQAQAGSLRDLALGLLAIAFGSVFFQAIQKVAVLRIQGKVDYSLQAALWDRLLSLPTRFFRDYSAGDLADRADGISKIRSIIAGAGIAALLGVFTSFFNAVQMFTYNWKLFLAALAISSLYTLLTVACNYLQMGFRRTELDLVGSIRGFVLQLISCVAKLRVQGAEAYAFKAWAQRFSNQCRVAMKARIWSSWVLTMNAGFPLVATGILFGLFYYLAEKANETGEKLDFTTGDFLAFMAAFGLFQAALQAMGDASVSLLQVIPNLERLDPILASIPEAATIHRHPGELSGGVSLSGVRFRYGETGPWLINDLSIDIRPGDFVAIVGSSGAGKSTLLRLLLGFEKPVTGNVLYDGQDLASLDIKAVRRQLGVVLQDSKVLPAEIYRNIVGASSRSVEEAWEAASKAGFDKDIRQMPMNMHTYVSEGGGTLSGGQRQRLMIARALVDEPRILLFDEATSALDNHAQAIVTESMQKLKVTRIVIAHRLSTIRDANRICYLDSGVIVEEGTFEQLMALNGEFAAMAKRQLD